MRAILAAVLTLVVSVPTIAGTSITPGSKLTAFIDMCKTEVRGDIKDKLGLRKLKIDPTGFCVCVGLSLDRYISDDDVLALAGKPLPEAFLDKYEATQGFCLVLMVPH